MLLRRHISRGALYFCVRRSHDNSVLLLFSQDTHVAAAANAVVSASAAAAAAAVSTNIGYCFYKLDKLSLCAAAPGAALYRQPQPLCASVKNLAQDGL
jgi:hypothetical protein